MCHCANGYSSCLIWKMLASFDTDLQILGESLFFFFNFLVYRLFCDTEGEIKMKDPKLLKRS